MTQHSQTIVLAFSPNLAAQIGLGESIVLSQMAYWLSKTKHFIQGKPWVYNSYEAWEKQFPFWSKRTIARLILSLERQGLILSQNFNAKKTNRTKWYSLDFDKIPDLTVQPCLSPTGQPVSFHEDKLSSSLKTKNTLQRMKERVVGKFVSDKPANSQFGFKKKTVLEQWQLSAEGRMQTIQKLACQKMAGLPAWDEERVESELLRFKTYYADKGNSGKRDWDAVWHLWCSRAQSFALERQKRFEDRDKNFGLNSKSSDDCVQKWRQERDKEKALEQELSRELSSKLSKEGRGNLPVQEPQNKTNALKSTEEIWLNVSKTLIKQVGAGAYTSWLKDIDVQTGEDKSVVLKAKSRFSADYISTHLLDKIKNAFESTLSGRITLSVVA